MSLLCRSTLATSLGAVFALSGLLAACSSSTLPPPSGDPSASGGLPDGGSMDGGTNVSSDAATDSSTDTSTTTDGAAGCSSLTPGPVVSETVITTPRPDAIGGALVAGTYMLTERDFYTPSADGPPGGDVVQGILVIVDGTKLGLHHLQTAQGVTNVTAGDFSYVVLDTILSETQTCPTASAPTNVPFSVMGSELWLFPTAGTREIYTRQ